MCRLKKESSHSMFHTGQKVICIKRGKWTDRISGKISIMAPQHREICIIVDIDIWEDRIFLELRGHVGEWEAKNFRPLVSSDKQKVAKQREPV